MIKETYILSHINSEQHKIITVLPIHKSIILKNISKILDINKTNFSKFFSAIIQLIKKLNVKKKVEIKVSLKDSFN